MRVVHQLLRPRAAVVTALAYALVLGLVDLVVHLQPPRTADAWLRWCSTDLDNLASHPVAVLVVSAFVTEDAVLPWMGLAVVALWACVRVLGGNRSAVGLTVGVVAAVHVLATLVSEGLLALRIGLGDEPSSARQLLDIGPSYLVVAALVVAVTAGRGVERIACAAGFVVVAPSLFDGLDHWDVAALGHAAAIVLAVAFGLVQRHRLRRAG